MPVTGLRGGDPAALGPFTLQGRIGAGGMGVVFLAHDQSGASVAVKTLPVGVPAEFRARLRREAQLLATLDDPRIARFVAADIEAAQPWLAMQYVAGPSLAEVPVPLAPLALRQLCEGLAEAIAALHARGLAHRDIKPGNVILTFDGPVLVDFGIAASTELTSITATGMAAGSPAWMAPEQRATGVAGPSADIWGWGCVSYLAATGRPPFGPGVTPDHANLNVDALPYWLREPVIGALAWEPGARPTATDLLTQASRTTMPLPTASRQAADTTATLANDATLVGPAPAGQRPRPGQRWLWPAVVIAALAAVGAGIGAFAATRGPTRSAGAPSSRSASLSSGPVGRSSGRPSTPSSATRISTTSGAASPVSIGTGTGDVRVGDTHGGYSFELPANWHPTTPRSGINARAWADPTNQAQVYVTVAPNPNGADTPQSALQSCEQVAAMTRSTVTYTYSDSKIYICTGFTASGSVHYERGVIGPHTEYTLFWDYPADKKPTMDPVLQRSVNTFQPGPL